MLVGPLVGVNHWWCVDLGSGVDGVYRLAPPCSHDHTAAVSEKDSYGDNVVNAPGRTVLGMWTASSYQSAGTPRNRHKRCR